METKMDIKKESEEILKEIPIEKLKEMINSKDEKTVKEGTSKIYTLASDHPELITGDLWIRLAIQAWEFEDIQIEVEQIFANIAKKTPQYVPIKTLRNMAEEKLWYVRYLVIWTLHNMSFKNPEMVPEDLVIVLTKDKEWWNRDFAKIVLGKIKGSSQ